MNSRLKKYWLPHSLDSSARIAEALTDKAGQALLASCGAAVPFLVYVLVHVFPWYRNPVEFSLYAALTVFFFITFGLGLRYREFRKKLRSYMVYSLPLGTAGLYYNMTVSDPSLPSMMGTIVCMVYVSTLIRTKAEGAFALGYFLCATIVCAVHHPGGVFIDAYTPAAFACMLFLSISHYFRIGREGTQVERSQVLANSLELWKRMLDNPSINLALIDCSGNFVEIGRGKTATGKDVEIGSNFRDYLPEEHVLRIEDCLDRSAATRQAVSYEFTMPVGVNRLITYSTTVWPVVEGGDILGFMVVSLDISDQIATTRKANHMSQVSILGQLSAGIAHEIRNPLTVIDGNLDLLESLVGKNAAPDALLQRVRKVRGMTARIGDIVKNVSRMYHSGEHEPVSREPVCKIVRDALAFSDQKLKERQIKISVDQADQELAVDCRPLLVSQAIVNLIHNAIDATQQLSERWIKVEIIDLGAAVRISVIDSGNGVPESVLANLGDAFNTTKGPGKGTGLGINLAMKIVGEHGGEFSYDRASRHTKFDMILPKESTAASAA